MRPNPKGGFHYICDLPAGSHKQVDEKKPSFSSFLVRRSHLFYATCRQTFNLTNKKSSKLGQCRLINDIYRVYQAIGSRHERPNIL